MLWPVSAVVLKLPRKQHTSATSSKVENCPSTVFLSITLRMTSSSVMPRVWNRVNRSQSIDQSSEILYEDEDDEDDIDSMVRLVRIVARTLACSGICFSTKGVSTKPGHTTFDAIPNSPPSLATARAKPMIPSERVATSRIE